MAYLASTALCIVFIELFCALKIQDNVSGVMSIAKNSLDVLSSAELDDLEKERIFRRVFLSSVKETVSFLVKFTGMAAVLFAIGFAFVRLGLVSESSLYQAMTSLPVLAGLTVAAVLYVKVRNVCRQRLLRH